MSNSSIGRNCNIGQNVVISQVLKLEITVKFKTMFQSILVLIVRMMFLGPSMVFTNVINPRSEINRQGQYLKTTVKRGATIGANATIVCGNEIGEYSFIGAGSVVTKKLNPFHW